jgi:hypothetical protein
MAVRGAVVVGAAFLSFADCASFLVDVAAVPVAPPPITEVYTDLTSFAEDFKNPNRLARPLGFAYRRQWSNTLHDKLEGNLLTRWMTPKYGVPRKTLSPKTTS